MSKLSELTIGVLYGGPSAEREVSLDSGKNVAEALEQAGHSVKRVIVDAGFDVNTARSLDIDIAFLALHGEFGEDGQIQVILEEAGIPYTGSGPDASALAFDKILSKRAYERAGVPTAAWMSLDRAEYQRMGEPSGLDIFPPVVAKPATSGSSLGVTIVKQYQQIGNAMERAFRYGESVLIERFVAGREFTVAVLGSEALPVIELKADAEFYDYDAKYKSDATQYICPAQIPDELALKARKYALAAHHALGCEDVSRTDMILDQNGMWWVLETNTLPGLTSHSLLPKAAKARGISFTELCEDLLSRALVRSEMRKTMAA